MNKFELFDKTGRPLLRHVLVLYTALFGLAMVIAAFRWSFGHPLPPVPGETILLAMLPQIPQVTDLLTRAQQRLREIDFGRVGNISMVNPHGGPSAP